MVTEASMLKISTIEQDTQRQLILEGKIVGPWAAELKSACEKAKADLRGRELVVDMKHLTAISQEGENVLLELMSDGIKFRCRDVFTKHVLKQLSQRAITPMRESKR
jgi:hypothetical protein